MNVRTNNTTLRGKKYTQSSTQECSGRYKMEGLAGDSRKRFNL
jgi:hypothetical protein